MREQKLKLSEIEVDSAAQPRAGSLNQEHVEELADAYRAKRTIEPPTVWLVGKVYKLAQGFHRYEAAKRAGLTSLVFRIEEGSETDWRVDAACSNQGHGLKRTNKDKRRCVTLLFKLLPEKSNRMLAEMAGVSDEFVRNLRPEAPAVLPTVGNTQEAKREGKDGRSYNASKPKPPESKAETPAAESSTTPPPAEVADAQASDAEPVIAPQPARPAAGQADTPPKPDPLANLIDPLGQSIPRGVQDTFGDPAMRNAVERIRAAHAELVSIANHVKGSLARKSQFWPFARCGDCARELLNAADTTATAMSFVEAGLPFCVCQKCKGAGCPHCRDGGYLPKWKHEGRDQYGV